MTDPCGREMVGPHLGRGQDIDGTDAADAQYPLLSTPVDPGPVSAEEAARRTPPDADGAPGQWESIASTTAWNPNPFATRDAHSSTAGVVESHDGAGSRADAGQGPSLVIEDGVGDNVGTTSQIPPGVGEDADDDEWWNSKDDDASHDPAALPNVNESLPGRLTVMEPVARAEEAAPSRGIQQEALHTVRSEHEPQPQPFVASQVDEAPASVGPSGRRLTPPSDTPRQTNGTYQIKHITWIDASAAIRQSPILVQNANGPCPLVALVNALSLSVSLNEESGFEKTLHVREQVSLGLLLDAVVDELIYRSGGDAAQGLPDVGDLYAFLTTLHTGMNVNPRFVSASPAPPNLMDAPVDAVDVATEARPDVEASGSFEETKDMQLYGTFSVPLVHGWLPSQDHPAYAALQRSARTYEDAQNLLFREEELEGKLRTEGLSREEQQLLQDVVIIKYFLAQSATQLTAHGLEVLKKAMPPGAVFILFRNDHFSTVYRHPRSHQLFQLVTDMGYATHDEVVWESLVDVTGEGSEFFTGDFRPVSGRTTPRAGQHVASSGEGHRNDGRGANTAPHGNQGRGRAASQAFDGAAGAGRRDSQADPPNGRRGTPEDEPIVPSNLTAEQEDHDLALALQLQEEEDELHERDLVRQREAALSREVLSDQAFPPNAGRRPVRARGQQIRPLIPPRSPTEPRRAEPHQPPTTMGTGADAPPPTYEQAASGAPFYPPPHHPAHPSNPAVSGAESDAASPGRPVGLRPLPFRPGRMMSGGPAPRDRFSSVQGSPGHGQPGRGRGQGSGPTGREPPAMPENARGSGGGKKECVVM